MVDVTQEAVPTQGGITPESPSASARRSLDTCYLRATYLRARLHFVPEQTSDAEVCELARLRKRLRQRWGVTCP